MTLGREWTRGVDSLVAGRYRLVRRLGSGGTGVVWLATDERLHREVAVKQVLASAGSAEDQQQRFLREGRITASFAHPHSIAMYDVVLDFGQPWLVMEYLPSHSLAGVLSIRRTLPAVRVAQIGMQVADALAAAHDVGVVHRDVKPANVLIAEETPGRPTAKITDFGLSRIREDAATEEVDVITGTAAYLAPEVARGQPATEPSDVFALGSTLFTAVEGVPPFGTDDDTGALLRRVAGGGIDPPRRAGALTPVLLWMLEPGPHQRPTMQQARDELARVAARRGDDFGPARTRVAKTKRRPRAAADGLRSRLRRPTLRMSVSVRRRHRDRGQQGSQVTYRPPPLVEAWQKGHRLVPGMARSAQARLRLLHQAVVRTMRLRRAMTPGTIITRAAPATHLNQPGSENPRATSRAANTSSKAKRS